MNRNKLRILILVAAFLMLCVVGSFAFLLNHTDLVTGETTHPSTDTGEAATHLSDTPTTSTAEPTEVTTAATTEATTEATMETTVVTETTEAVSTDIGLQAAQIAITQLGKPYKYGSAGPDTFDTSGLVQFCYQQCGFSIPRSNSALATAGYVVEKDRLLPGDAVFFWSSNQGTPEYLGIYVGGGMVVAALNASKPVVQFDMNSSYYTEHFVFARRFY